MLHSNAFVLRLSPEIMSTIFLNNSQSVFPILGENHFGTACSHTCRSCCGQTPQLWTNFTYYAGKKISDSGTLALWIEWGERSWSTLLGIDISPRSCTPSAFDHYHSKAVDLTLEFLDILLQQSMLSGGVHLNCMPMVTGNCGVGPMSCPV